MRQRKIEAQRERRIAIAMVTSRRFLAHAAKVLDPGLIRAEHLRVVVDWCMKYHLEYGRAPRRNVEGLFFRWSEDNPNVALVGAVKDFLEELSDQAARKDKPNIDYLLDDLRDFATKRKIQQLQESVEYALTHGSVEEAERALVSYRRVEVGMGSGFDPMRDCTGWKEAFSEPAEPIVRFEGDAGTFFNHALTRDALVGVQAPEKTGKTWWCVEFAMRALRQRRRVALFEVGDLSKLQLMRRMGMRWAGRPLWKGQCGKIPVPVDIVVDSSEEAGYAVKLAYKKVPDPLDYQSVQRGIARFRRVCGMGKGDFIRASVHATGTIDVRGICSILDQWAQEEDFVPDVVIIDYADILAPEDAKKQPRDQANETWAALRRLSQERHALVIAPTQANTMAYEAKLQTMRHFSEDKRKNAHVTAMLALNQSPEEKDSQCMRLNWTVVREAPYQATRALYVGQCLALGKALCCASLG